MFSTANAIALRRGAAAAPYRPELIAEEAGPVAAWSGLALEATRGFQSVHGRLDTLLVAGGSEAGVRAAATTRGLLSFLRRSAKRTRRMGSVCTGAFALAEAGLLAGRRATTHWRAADRLAALHPDVEVCPDAIYVEDRGVFTSAGVTAGMDLALALVEQDLGRAIALRTARQMVMFMKRPGGQAQFSEELRVQQRAHDADVRHSYDRHHHYRWPG